MLMTAQHISKEFKILEYFYQNTEKLISLYHKRCILNITFKNRLFKTILF